MQANSDLFLPPEELERKRNTFRQVFNTEDGKAVLADLLNEFGYWNPPETMEGLALLKGAHYILRILGPIDPSDPEKWFKHVEKMMEMPHSIHRKEK